MTNSIFTNQGLQNTLDRFFGIGTAVVASRTANSAGSTTTIVDTGANYTTSGVQVGDIVLITAGGGFTSGANNTHYVTIVNSATQITVTPAAAGATSNTTVYSIVGPHAPRAICVDDGTANLGASDTQMNGTNVRNQGFDSNPSVTASQTITVTTTIAAGNGNFTHKRVGLTNVADSTTSPVTGLLTAVDAGGSSNIAIVKTSNFSVAYVMSIVAADAGVSNKLTVNQGLTQVVNSLFGVFGASANSGIDLLPKAIGIDDNSSAFVAGDTTFVGTSNTFCQPFDSTPTRSGQVVSASVTVTTGNANFTWKRVNFNQQANTGTQSGAPGSALSGLMACVSSVSFLKSSQFSNKITLSWTQTSG